MNNMTLGSKLKSTMENAANSADKSRLDKIKKERTDIITRLNGYRDSIVGQINDDAMPKVKITDYNIRSWMTKAIDNIAPHQDLWADFMDFFESEDLFVYLREEHDGEGIRDWSIMTVRPMQGLKNASKS